MPFVPQPFAPNLPQTYDLGVGPGVCPFDGLPSRHIGSSDYANVCDNGHTFKFSNIVGVPELIYAGGLNKQGLVGQETPTGSVKFIQG